MKQLPQDQTAKQVGAGGVRPQTQAQSDNKASPLRPQRLH